MRLDKLLADSGYGTRTEVKKLISKKCVEINGKIVTDSGFKATLDDDIRVKGESVCTKKNLYFIFDKPDEVLTAMEDKRLPNVGDFIPENLSGRKLSPVGRLDYHTTGLLIITNDGELSHRLTSPKYNIPKIYKVSYDGPALGQEHIDEARSGIKLTDTDQVIELKPSVLELASDNVCYITLTEGKTHEVRRIISHWGRQVLSLRRVSLGPISLEEENPGRLTELTGTDLNQLLEVTGLLSEGAK